MEKPIDWKKIITSYHTFPIGDAGNREIQARSLIDDYKSNFFERLLK